MSEQNPLEDVKLFTQEPVEMEILYQAFLKRFQQDFPLLLQIMASFEGHLNQQHQNTEKVTGVGE